MKTNAKMMLMILAAAGACANADLFRVTMSGQVTSVTDTRTSGDDTFDGTAWDVDMYSPSVGDAWVYEVIYDTSIGPSDFNDMGSSQYAIYDASFASSISLAGRTISGFNSVTNFFGGDVEIFGGKSFGGEVLDVFAFFTRHDGLDDLINGGMLPTSASFFDGLDLTTIWITNGEDFDVRMAPTEPITITVEQIPAPASLTLLACGGLVTARRRRR